MGRQPQKMTVQVLNAIRNLCDIHGSSSKQILNYVMAQNDANRDPPIVQRQIQGALKRGLAYGILRKINGHYTVTSDAEMDKIDTILEPTRRRRVRRRGRKTRRRRGRKSRSRRRPRSRGRKRGGSRRRSRGRKRSRSRRRRSSRRRRRASSTGIGRKPPICDYCRSIGRKSQDLDLQKRSPSQEEVLENQAPEQQREEQSRRSKSRQRNRSRSRSVANKDSTASD